MEYYIQPLSEYQDCLLKACLSLPCPVEQACFFDIETTGLSPQISSLFLLGAAYLEKGEWYLIQWFADDYTSEADILTAFADFISKFDTMIHYNGSTFDIPYLEKKYRAYHLPSPFVGKNSLDLYRQFPRKKDWFHLPNQKLTTMEQLFGFQRHDHYSGKDCIRLYTDFMQKKYFRDETSATYKNNLLLHNHDDLIGTILCSQLLCYINLHPENPEQQTIDNTFVISAKLHSAVPLPLIYEHEGNEIQLKDNTIHVHIPLYHSTLYHYFKDYKNYYYLPEEDMAIHKSVATYVDPAFRQKATASNCYIKKTGIFLPLPANMKIQQPTFQKTRRDTHSYLAWTKHSSLTKEECLAYLSYVIHTKQ